MMSFPVMDSTPSWTARHLLAGKQAGGTHPTGMLSYSEWFHDTLAHHSRISKLNASPFFLYEKR